MAEERVVERRELMVPYRRPYRHTLAVVWARTPSMRRWAYAAGVGWTALLVGVAIGSAPLGGTGALVAILGSFAMVSWLTAIAGDAARLRRPWRRRTELGAVRRRRPQAGSEDPDIAHDEFAVTVQDDGYLVTWRFRPLRVDEAPGVAEVEVPGRPRYGASPIDQRAFDPRDAARAAEQLVEAQERAAAREEAAVAAVHRARADAVQQAEVAEEARSTAAALQRTTGQRPRRG